MSGKKSCDKKGHSLVKRGISNVLSFVIVHAVAVVKLVEVHTVGLVSRHGKRCEEEPVLEEGKKDPIMAEGNQSGIVLLTESEPEENVEEESHKHEKRRCPIKYDEGSKYWEKVKDVYNVAKDSWKELSTIKDGHKGVVTAFRRETTEKLLNAM